MTQKNSNKKDALEEVISEEQKVQPLNAVKTDNTLSPAPSDDTSEVLSGSYQQQLASRRATATQNMHRVLRDFEDKQQTVTSARRALAEELRPRDTSMQERYLRRLAIGQAAGELLGTLFSGAFALKDGSGYIPQMPGAYKQTLAQLHKLQSNGIDARKNYGELMRRIGIQEAEDAAKIAKQRYSMAEKEQARLQRLEDYVARQQTQWDHRKKYGKQQMEDKRTLQKDRHEYRLEELKRKADLTGKTPLSSAEQHIAGLLLPKQATTTRNTRYGTSTTTRDVTTHSKAMVNAAQALAKKIAPIQEKYKLSDKEILYLNGITKNYPVTWEALDALLEKNISVDEISQYISTQLK